MPAAKTDKEHKEKFWLYAFRDHLANLRAYGNCLCTADVNGDGDYKLLVADGSKKLKTYAGTALSQEVRLLGVPSAVTSFYMDTGDAFKRPVVAVAVGPFIFMYKNAKPLYRFTTPPVQLDPEEVETWDALTRGNIAIDVATEIFDRKLDEGVDVSSRTLELLLMDNATEKEAFVLRFMDKPLQQHDVVVCMTSLNLSRPEEGQPGCLVYGTERRLLNILSNDVAQVKVRVQLPSAPVFMLTAGTFNGDYRVVVSCRDGRIYSVKDGALSASVIQPDAQPCGISRYDNLIAVITMANTLSYYNLKGKRSEVVFLPTPAVCISTIMDTVTGGARGVVVALGDGKIQVYVGKYLQHVSQAFGCVTAMSYCRYGREDAALVLVLQNGSLVVELLHRNANLSVSNERNAKASLELEEPIPVPKLSSVFAVQTEREKEYGVDMYHNYHYDLRHLTLLTTKSYLGMMTNGVVPELPAPASSAAVAVRALECAQPQTAAVRTSVSVVEGQSLTAEEEAPAMPAAQPELGTPEILDTPGAMNSFAGGGGGEITLEQRSTAVLGDTSAVRFSASVQGLGPLYRIKGVIQNTGDVPMYNLVVVFLFDGEIYKMPKALVNVPFLVPGLAYPCDALVELQEGETKGEGVLAVILGGEDEKKPLCSTLVDLPEADLVDGL